MWHSHKNEPQCTVESLNGYVQLLKLKKNMRDYIRYMSRWEYFDSNTEFSSGHIHC